MPGYDRYMNWRTVTFNSVTLNGVTSVSFDRGGQMAQFAGDGDRYATLAVNNMNVPTATVTLGNVKQAVDLTAGTFSTFVATLMDARNQTTGSGSFALTFTLSNAFVVNVAAAGSHASFASGTISFGCYATDGQTNPLSVAQTT